MKGASCRLPDILWKFSRFQILECLRRPFLLSFSNPKIQNLKHFEYQVSDFRVLGIFWIRDAQPVPSSLTWGLAKPPPPPPRPYSLCACSSLRPPLSCASRARPGGRVPHMTSLQIAPAGNSDQSWAHQIPLQVMSLSGVPS